MPKHTLHELSDDLIIDLASVSKKATCGSSYPQRLAKYNISHQIVGEQNLHAHVFEFLGVVKDPRLAAEVISMQNL
jgi:hypothetical protein